jgi:hypothetical protein
VRQCWHVSSPQNTSSSKLNVLQGKMFQEFLTSIRAFLLILQNIPSYNCV